MATPRKGQRSGPRRAVPPAPGAARAREIQALEAIAALIARGAELAETAADTLAVVCRLTRVGIGAIYRLTPDARHLDLLANQGEPPDLMATGQRRPVDGSLMGVAVRTGQPSTASLVKRPPGDPRMRELARKYGHKTQLVLPIPVGESVWGVIALVSTEQRRFRRPEIAWLEAVARHVGLAVQRASLQADADEKRRRMESLNRIAHTVIADLSLPDVLAAVAAAALTLVPNGAVRIWLAEGDQITVAAEVGVHHPEHPQAAYRRMIGEGLVGQTIERREALVIARVRADARVADDEWIALEAFESLAVFTLAIGERVLGALIAFGRAGDQLVDDDLDMLRAFGSQAAIAIENARLLEEARRSAARYRALFQVGNMVGASLEVDRILDLVVDRCCSVMGVRAAGIFRIERESDVLAYQRGVGLSREFIARLRVRTGHGTTGRAVAERRPVWSANILDDPAAPIEPEVRELVVREGYQSTLSVPVAAQGDPFGALAVYWWEPHEPTVAEIELLQGLATLAAVTLENARLFEAARLREARLRTLGRVNQVVSSSLDLDAVLGAIVSAATELFDGTPAWIWVADDTDAVEPRAFSDPRLHEGYPVRRAVLHEGFVGWVAAHRQLIEVPDVFADDRFLRSATDWWRHHGFRSFVGVPIVWNDGLLGVLSFAAARPLRVGAEERELLETLVGQAAIAMRNARLYAETRQRLDETRALLSVAEILNSTLEPRPLLEQAAIAIARACQVDRCTIERVEEERVVPLMAQFADGRSAPELWRAFTAGAANPPRLAPAQARAVEWMEPVVIQDSAASDLIPREWVETFGHRASMVVPLVRKDRVMGLLTLDYCERAETFRPWQKGLAQAIAGQLALSLENLRLFTEAEERLRETSTLLAIGRALSQRAPAAEIMRRAAREAGRAFGADMVGIYALDPTGSHLRPVAGYQVPRELRRLFGERPFELARFPALLEAWRAGEAIGSGDVHADPRFDPDVFEGVPPHSVLMAPTFVRDQPVGAVFLIWWERGRAFTASELRIVSGVAGQVGLAMENAELTRQTEAKLRETETLLAVSQTLASTLDMEGLPRALVRHVTRTMGADTGGLWMLDESGQALVPVMGYHVPPDRLSLLRGRSIPLAESPFFAEALRTRRPVFAHDVGNDPRFAYPADDRTMPCALLFVPIVANDRTLGGFAAVWWSQARELAPTELRLAEAVANQAGVALENARLFLDHQRRVEELSVLYELSRAVTGRLDRAELLEVFQAQVPRVLEGRNLVVLLLDPERDDIEVALRVQDGQPAMRVPLRYARHGFGLMSVVLASGRPLRTSDYAAECRARGVVPVPAVAQYPFWLGAPLAAGDQLLGMVAMSGAERAFSERDERLLTSIADLMALALRSARLFEERTRALGELAAAQDQLVRTEKLRALGEMASGVAHDFNNLLAAILGRAQLLLEEVSHPTHRRWLEVIERSAMDGAETVRRLQGFTRIRRDQPFVSVDLNRIVREALEVTEARWREEPRSRGVSIEVDTALMPALPRVAGDPVELREVLTNLVLNAVDAMPAGGSLTLATARVGDRLEVTVADTGVGMPAEVRERIFDPFFTTKGPQGTGLGLSITYGILTRHGAQVAVDSQPGQGTTFRLSFPRSELSDDVPSDVPAAAEAGPLRCLVVDDEPAVGEVLGDILISMGHAATVLQDSRQAPRAFELEHYDAVFTDLAMPGLSGWEVARAIKDRHPEVPIFMITGFGVEVSPQELEANGVDRVLPKPLKIQDVRTLLSTVRRHDG